MSCNAGRRAEKDLALKAAAIYAKSLSTSSKLFGGFPSISNHSNINDLSGFGT